jgi:ribosomal protein S27AE
VGSEDKNRKETLSQIVADLVKSKGGEELSFKTHRLRDDIKQVIESEDTIFGKIRGLVESFREIIPDEKQRFNAAIKALSTTSKLNRQEIVKAVNNQLEELKILEKGLLSGIPGWRDEIKVMQDASQEIRDEILQLREKIVRLESEEKVILNSIAVREKEIEVVEKAIKEIFTDIGADITALKKRVEESSVESAVVQPIPPVGHAVAQPIPPGDSIKSVISSVEKGGGEQKSEIPEPSVPQGSKWQKKCPMCGGKMNFHSNEEKWMCYTCAYEELEKGGGEQKSEIRDSSAPQDSEWQKKCPMCGGQMNFQIEDNKWLCYSCAYEELKKDDFQGKSEEKREQTNAPQPAPVSEPINEYQGSKKGSSSNNQPPSKKKTCPACRKKMNWYPEDKAWRCPFCEYERRI